MTDEPLEKDSPDSSLDPSFLDAVGEIADGIPMDWNAALARTPDRDDAVRRLQRLEAVIQRHRRVASPPSETIPERTASPTLFTWGPLEVREKLGEGTFGEVYRAWDAGVGREVALKLRKPGTSSKDARRWLDEARRLARVRHPNVLVVYGADEHDGRAGIWTELLFGRTLEERLKREGPMGAREAALIGTDLCSALAAVHAAGLIHGDVKTTNIMREGASLSETPRDLRNTPGSRFEAGRIVLMDFGTAVERPDISGDAALRLYATPLTAAPEVLDGKKPSAASDLYSLAVVLYRLVTERYPIEASSLDELRAATKSGAWKSLRDVRPDLPAAFVQVIERALAPDPESRFTSAAEMERALAAALGAAPPSPSQRPRRRRRVSIAIAAVFFAIAAGIAWMTLRSPDTTLQTMVIPAASDSPVVARLAKTMTGTEREGTFGLVLEFADLNSDSVADYLVGAPHASGGHLYAYFGGPESDDQRDLEFARDPSADQFGRRACAAGDVNGDGLADLLVSETQGATGSGRAFLYLGAQPFDDVADLIFQGEESRDHFGIQMLMFDFNGDDVDDIVVASYFHDLDAGRVYVYFGGKRPDVAPDMMIDGDARGDALGNAMSHADLDGDGYEDLVVAAYWSNSKTGRVYVYRGGTSPDIVPDFMLDGVAAGSEFANSVAAGDYDGDGRADLLVGAHVSAAAGFEVGSVYGYRGGPSMDREADWTLVGESAGDHFGTNVELCDVSGDGKADAIVSAPLCDAGGQDVGRVYVFLGGRKPDAIPDIVLTGKAPGDWFGVLFRATSDTGDGGAALLVGAHLNNEGAFAAGQAYLYQFERRHVP